MKFRYKIMVLALASVMAVGCGGKKDGPEGQGHGGPGGPGGEAQKEATAVYADNPNVGTIRNQYTYSGTISPNEQVTVAGTVQGKVATVNYDVGDSVSAGAVLYTMDTSSLNNAVRSAEASLNAARTSLKQTEGGAVQTQINNSKNAITSCETAVENAKVGLDSARVALEKAQSDYDTNKQLFDVGGISQDTLTTLENALTQAKNNYTNAELGLKSAEDSLAQAQSSYDILVNQTIGENKESAQNAVNSAQIALDSARKNLSDAAVVSPISGTVLECNVTAGATLSTNAPFIIIDQSTVNVEVNVSEQIISALSIDSSADISVSTLNNSFTGHVTELAPGANSDGTYTVKINIDNSDGKLKSGMSAKVAFDKEISTNAMVLPRDAVLDEDGEYYVFVADGDTAAKKAVEIGVDGGSEIEVTSGIEPSDLVITKGQTYLTDGAPLNVVKINGEVVSE